MPAKKMRDKRSREDLTPGTADHYRSHFSKPQLMELVRRHLQKKPPQNTRKERLVGMLVRNDENFKKLQGFRFLDLPPELRNIIYRNLLLIPDQRPKYALRASCFPHILQTCRQVTSEAKGILFQENTGKVGIEYTTNMNGPAILALSNSDASETVLSITGALTNDLKAMSEKWSTQTRLLNFRKLEITLRLRVFTGGIIERSAFRLVSQALYALASFLSRSAFLRNVAINVVVGGPAAFRALIWQIDRFEAMLFPLRVFREAVTIKLEGVQEILKNRIITTKPLSGPLHSDALHEISVALPIAEQTVASMKAQGSQGGHMGLYFKKFIAESRTVLNWQWTIDAKLHCKTMNAAEDARSILRTGFPLGSAYRGSSGYDDSSLTSLTSTDSSG